MYKQKPNRKVPITGSTLYLYFHLLGREFYFKSQNTKDSLALYNLYYQKKIAIYGDSLKYNNRFDSTLTKLNHKDSLKLNKLESKFKRKFAKLDRKLTEGNFMMRTIGEAPSLLDTNNLNATVQQFKYFYQSKGYLKSNISWESDTLGKNVFVKYKINENQQSIIDSLVWNIQDSTIKKTIKRLISKTQIKVGTPYNESQIQEQRELITKRLKDKGYFEFEKQFVDYEVDTTNIYKLKLTINIVNPNDKPRHTLFKIDSVYFFIDKPKKTSNPILIVNQDKTVFQFYSKKYSTKILNSKNRIYPDSVYSNSITQKTLNQLSNLDIFKFVTINYIKSVTDSSKLKAYINANSYPKYQITDEWGATISQGQVIPGPMVNINFTDRNSIGNCDVLSLNLNGSVLGQPSVTQPNTVTRTTQFGGNLSLTIPQLYMPTRLRFKFAENNPKTRFTFSYSNVIRDEYTRSIYKGSLNYIYQVNKFSQLTVTPVDVSVVNTSAKSIDFETKLDELSKKGNYLKYSFSQSIVSDIGAYYIYNNNDPSLNNKSQQFRCSAEIGGFLFHVFGNLTDNQLFGLDYYKFTKLSFDYRKYMPTSKTGTIALRVNVGTAIPYGNSKALPYEKNFFAGGSNSVRAWQPRRLGLGSDSTNRITNYSIEQAGQIIIEGSLERRFKVIKFLDGAVFVDAGNVWNASTNDKTETRFKASSFFKEIAVGAGYGVRFNFSFFILRFDFAYKVWDPSQALENRLVIKKLRFNNAFRSSGTGKLVYQIGIGYPF